MISIKLEKTKQNHGYESQIKLWEYFAASCGFLYPPFRGIVQLTNSVARRFRNWSFNNKLLAVSASIIIHVVVGLFLIVGLSNDLHFTLGLNKSNTAWVSLESVSGNTSIPSQAKRADGKRSSAKSEVVSRRTAIQEDKINSITTISATKNIPVQSYTVQEDKVSSAGSATGPACSGQRGSTSSAAACQRTNCH